MAERLNAGRRAPHGEAPLRPISADDAWAAETRKRAALAVGQWLEQGKLDRVVRTLQLWELEAIATAAISAYIAARHEMQPDPEPPAVGIAP